MKQSSKRLVSIVGSLLLVVAALVIFFDIVQPEYGSVEEIKGQLVAENELLQNETQAVAAAQKVISEYQQDGQDEQSAALALPPDQDIAGALAQIYGLAQNNGVIIQNVTVSVPTIKVQQGSANGQTTESTTKPLGSFSFQVSGAGSYESFKSFITGLETNIRIFDVESISLSPGQTTGNTSNHDFFTYTVTVATYYQTN